MKSLELVKIAGSFQCFCNPPNSRHGLHDLQHAYVAYLHVYAHKRPWFIVSSEDYIPVVIGLICAGAEVLHHDPLGHDGWHGWQGGPEGLHHHWGHERAVPHHVGDWRKPHSCHPHQRHPQDQALLWKGRIWTVLCKQNHASARFSTGMEVLKLFSMMLALAQRRKQVGYTFLVMLALTQREKI